MTPTVFMDPAAAPTGEEVARALGPKTLLWESLTSRLEHAYDIEPTLVPPSRSYGWDVKYRKGGRTLVSLTPDEGAFTALVVLGAKEVAAARELDLGRHARQVFEDAPQYHDGRWLFLSVETERDVEDVLALVALKRRQRAKASRAPLPSRLSGYFVT